MNPGQCRDRQEHKQHPCYVDKGLVIYFLIQSLLPLLGKDEPGSVAIFLLKLLAFHACSLFSIVWLEAKQAPYVYSGLEGPKQALYLS